MESKTPSVAGVALDVIATLPGREDKAVEFQPHFCHSITHDAFFLQAEQALNEQHADSFAATIGPNCISVIFGEDHGSVVLTEAQLFQSSLDVRHAAENVMAKLTQVSPTLCIQWELVTAKNQCGVATGFLIQMFGKQPSKSSLRASSQLSGKHGSWISKINSPLAWGCVIAFAVIGTCIYLRLSHNKQNAAAQHSTHACIHPHHVSRMRPYL